MSIDSTAERGSRLGLVIRGLSALVVLAILIGLGVWQLERKAWKEGLIDTLSARMAALPMDIPPRERWDALDPTDLEFRHVAFSAEFLPKQEALVYTAGSAFRPDVSGPGYWVMAPARLADGSIVVVNRGFVPEDRRDAASRQDGEPRGPQDLVGVMRWPEPRGWFTPKDDPDRNLWFTRDPNDIASAKHWGRVAPFFVELESPLPPGGLPRAGQLHVQLRNPHLGYAITWFGLAIALVVLFAVWLRSSLASPGPAGGRGPESPER